MIVLILRLMILIAIIVLIYAGFRYLLNPKRKLELSQEQKQFYLLDEEGNVHKNFLLTYKGALFEGEKYLGTTDQSFDIITISISVKDSSKLRGFTKEDFLYLEKEIIKSYPHASINWKDPIHTLLKK